MSILSLIDVSITFDGPLLLDRVNLHIEEGERVCLLGRNGEGKSTLMRLMTGGLTPDSGEVVTRQGVVLGFVPQEVPTEIEGTVFQVAVSQMGDVGPVLAEFQTLSGHSDEESTVRLCTVQERMDELGGWEQLNRVEQILSRLDLDGEAPFSFLSGGLKRRVLLARALASGPDILVLDEPTNHLDIDSIRWLEEFLVKEGRTLFFVTHDRSFLRSLATRILELDRGSLTSWNCTYDQFLDRKQEALHAEGKEWERFDKKLAQEEVWIRKGIKARRTRNEGRVKALKQMRKERHKRRERVGSVSMQAQEADRSGKLVAEVTDVSFDFGSGPVIDSLSVNIIRGDKIGIIGPNGAGKTTLLRILLGDLPPCSGRVRLGTNLQVAYSDQLREELDPNLTVYECIAEGNDFFEFNGERKHVITYLRDFLFPPERSRAPIRLLSGGERNRLLLARLFSRPSNVLVLDEPTNDLDMETLDLLEELLLEYRGTLLVVSHDRDFLNNVVTSSLVFEGQGRVTEYAGGYDDWLSQRPEPARVEPVRAPAPKQASAPPRRDQPRKLTFKESNELEKLPDRILLLETELEELHSRMGDPKFYTLDKKTMQEVLDREEPLKREIAAAYDRWEDLEAIREAWEISK